MFYQPPLCIIPRIANECKRFDCKFKDEAKIMDVIAAVKPLLYECSQVHVGPHVDSANQLLLVIVNFITANSVHTSGPAQRPNPKTQQMNILDIKV
jgi:hypothetical protein